MSKIFHGLVFNFFIFSLMKHTCFQYLSLRCPQVEVRYTFPVDAQRIQWARHCMGLFSTASLLEYIKILKCSQDSRERCSPLQARYTFSMDAQRIWVDKILHGLVFHLLICSLVKQTYLFTILSTALSSARSHIDLPYGCTEDSVGKTLHGLVLNGLPS